MLTVEELIARLQCFPASMKVIVSDDSESRDGYVAKNIRPLRYQPYNSVSGEIGIVELTDELIKAGWTEADLLENSEIAVVISP